MLGLTHGATSPARAADPLVLTLTDIGPGPDVAVTARLTRTGNPVADVKVRLLVRRDPGTFAQVGPGVATAADGFVSFTYPAPQDGTYVFRVVLTSDDGVRDEETRFVETNPVVALEVDGPLKALRDTPVEWELGARRFAGNRLFSGTLDVIVRPVGGTRIDAETVTIVEGIARYTSPALPPGDYQLRLRRSADDPDLQVLHTFSTVNTVLKSATADAVNQVRWPARPLIRGQLTGPGIAPASVGAFLWRGADATVSDQFQGAFTPTSAFALAERALRPQRRTFYRWRVPEYGVRSNVVVVEVLPLLSIDVTRRKGIDRIEGRTTPARVGTPLRLERRTVTGAWKTVARTRTTAASTALKVGRGAAYSFRLEAPRQRVFYRVILPADDGRLRLKSPKQRVG